MALAHAFTRSITSDEVSREAERDLVERAKRDRDAFAELYRCYRPLLLDHVYRRTGNADLTEDLVADTFLIILRSLPSHRDRGIPVRFWMLRIATNVVNRWARRARRHRARLSDPDRLLDVRIDAPASRVDNERVRKALLTLPPRSQAVLSLYYLEGLSVRETATVLGCRDGTVRSRLARARERLRWKLDGRS